MMRSRQPRVLLVEDNEDHAQLLLHCFREKYKHCQVIHIQNGERALDYLFRRGDFSDPTTNPAPHLILLDLRMPGIDGFKVLEKIRASKQHTYIPVVVLSSSFADRDILKAYKLRVNSYLLKPLNLSEYMELAKSINSYWLQENVFPHQLIN